MWVHITGYTDTGYVGELKSEPPTPDAPIALGQLVEFGPDHGINALPPALTSGTERLAGSVRLATTVTGGAPSAEGHRALEAGCAAARPFAPVSSESQAKSGSWR